MAGKQSRPAPPASNLTADAGMKKDLEEEAAEMLSSPPPSHEEPGVQGQQQNLSEEETETEGDGDIAFDMSLDEGKPRKEEMLPVLA